MYNSHRYMIAFVRTSLETDPVAPQIPLIYPQHTIMSPLLNLQTLVDKRAPRHKRGAWIWLLVSPLTAPFMLIRTSPRSRSARVEERKLWGS